MENKTTSPEKIIIDNVPTSNKLIAASLFLLFVVTIVPLSIYIGILIGQRQPFSEVPVAQVGTPVTPPPVKPVSSQQPSELGIKLFPYVDKDLLKIETSNYADPEDGYQIVSSILSPDGTKIAFTEVSTCFTEEYIACKEKSNYDITIKCSSCDENFRIVVKDIKTQSQKIIYNNAEQSLLGESNTGNNPINKIVPKAYAAIAMGGPVFVPFPIGWTPDSSHLIAASGILKSFPVGGGLQAYYQINTETKKLTLIGEGVVKFNQDFSDVALLKITKDSDFMLYCGEGSYVYGDIIEVKNLPDLKTLKSITGDIYKLGDFSTVLKYSSTPTAQAKSKYDNSETFFCNSDDKFEWQEKTLSF